MLTKIIKINLSNLVTFYRKVRGIPQGSILSPLLCNLYYGEAERQVGLGDAYALHFISFYLVLFCFVLFVSVCAVLCFGILCEDYLKDSCISDLPRIAEFHITLDLVVSDLN